METFEDMVMFSEKCTEKLQRYGAVVPKMYGSFKDTVMFFEKCKEKLQRWVSRRKIAPIRVSSANDKSKRQTKKKQVKHIRIWLRHSMPKYICFNQNVDQTSGPGIAK